VAAGVEPGWPVDFSSRPDRERPGYQGLYRMPSDGSGTPEQLVPPTATTDNLNSARVWSSHGVIDLPQRVLSPTGYLGHPTWWQGIAFRQLGFYGPISDVFTGWALACICVQSERQVRSLCPALSGGRTGYPGIDQRRLSTGVVAERASTLFHPWRGDHGRGCHAGPEFRPGPGPQPHALDR
jgi:hypothetical protein